MFFGMYQGYCKLIEALIWALYLIILTDNSEKKNWKCENCDKVAITFFSMAKKHKNRIARYKELQDTNLQL